MRISKDKVELVCMLLSIVGLVLCAVLIASLARADCFEEAYNGEVPRVRIGVNAHNHAFGCSNFWCVVDKAPLQRHKLNVYLGRELPTRVLWGNGGWEKSVATARNYNTARIRQKRQLRAIVRNAKQLALGVELESLIERHDLIAGDRDFHDRLTYETNCLRKEGKQRGSFYESVRIPRKFWRDDVRG